MNTLNANALVSLVLLLFFSRLPNHSPMVEATNNHSSDGTKTGFAFDLTHHGCPIYPFYGPRLSHSERLRTAVTCSNNLGIHLAKHNNTIQSVLKPIRFSYYMQFSIGNPPVEVLVDADTGSDLTWIQCQPCSKCYEQDKPIFDPRNSSTFKKNVPCGTNYCRALQTIHYKKSCGNSTIDDCKYDYQYGDSSTTRGILASETFTFNSSDGQSIQIPDFVFGCSNESIGIYDSRSSGIVGLGGGPLSLVSQLGSKMGWKFSTCLVPAGSNTTGKLKFGSEADIMSTHVQSTPLVSQINETFYRIRLEGVSVGNKRIANKATNGMNANVKNVNDGTIMIDSGTPMTFVAPELAVKVMYLVIGAVIESTELLPLINEESGFPFCYNTIDDDEFKVPDITFHFTGADWKLDKSHSFLRFTQVNQSCFAIAPYSGEATLGSHAQENFKVQYDIGNRMVSFAPADCAKD